MRRAGSSRSLTRFVIVLFGATTLLVAGVFVLLLISVVNLHGDDVAARRSSDVLLQSFAVERSVADLETGLRGFLLTDRRRFLEPYLLARVRLPGQLAGLRRLATGERQQLIVLEIADAIRHYIERYAQPVLATGMHLSPAQKIAVTSRGKALVDNLESRFETLDAEQVLLRQRKRLGANIGTALATVTAAVGLVCSLALLSWQLIYLVLRILRPIRVAAAAAERLAGGELTVRVPKVGSGEVATLDLSFNAMAHAIQSRDTELSSARARLEQAVHEARAVSAMKSNFLANTSHEIRTPLNGVIGMMNLIAETSLTVEQREYVDAARSSGDALMTVVNDILDIAKIEAGRLEIERRDFDLHDMVESTCDMVAATARSKGLELQSFVHDDVPRAVRGDRTRVSQVLANLVSNAVKFTARGEVVVEVSGGEYAGGRIAVRFDVRDTGIGIPAEQIQRLFEPFTQADAGTTREFGGTGLGLTIARELTQLMGGTIETTSEAGKGSTFSFTIPFEAAHAPLAMPVPAAQLRGLHVLVVDDNATNRRVLETYLASSGLRPEVARDAQEAIGRLRAAVREGDAFELAVLDCNMPGESGAQLARHIDAIPALRSTRLVLLTSSGQDEADAAEAGIGCRLTKPVRQARLLDAISVVMAHEKPDRHEAWRVPRADATPHRSAQARAMILVAEDHHVNWLLIERMLTKRGHAARNARDGRRAIEMLAVEEYDLVFMDCQMPVLDGYSATRCIRNWENAERRDRVPIVAMTAHAMLGDKERCISAGMDDYIAKPIRGDELDAMLARWLASKAGTQELDGRPLEQLRSLFPGAEMSNVVRQLVADLNEQMANIATALSSGDRAVASAAAHQVITTARVIGAHDLADAARRLERLAGEDHANGHVPLESALRALSACCRDTMAAAEQELGV